MKGRKFPFKLPSTEWGLPQSGNGLLHSWALRLPKRRLCQINSGVCPTKPELSPNYHSSFRSFHWSTIRSIDRKHTRTLKKVELHSKSKSSTIKSEQDETTNKNKRGKGEKKKSRVFTVNWSWRRYLNPCHTCHQTYQSQQQLASFKAGLGRSLAH